MKTILLRLKAILGQMELGKIGIAIEYLFIPACYETNPNGGKSNEVMDARINISGSVIRKVQRRVEVNERQKKCYFIIF